MPKHEDILQVFHSGCTVGVTEQFTLRCDLPDGTVLRSDESTPPRLYHDPRIDGGWTSYQRPPDWDDARVRGEKHERYYEQERDYS